MLYCCSTGISLFQCLKQLFLLKICMATVKHNNWNVWGRYNFWKNILLPRNWSNLTVNTFIMEHNKSILNQICLRYFLFITWSWMCVFELQFTLLILIHRTGLTVYLTHHKIWEWAQTVGSADWAYVLTEIVMQNCQVGQQRVSWQESDACAGITSKGLWALCMPAQLWQKQHFFKMSLKNECNLQLRIICIFGLSKSDLNKQTRRVVQVELYLYYLAFPNI